MKEIISIHVGQAGVQIGNACWELFCLEHDITPTGKMMENSLVQGDTNALFSMTCANKYLPRCVFIDLQPSAIDEIKTGSHRQLFHPNNLILSKQDSSNVYIRGNYLGKQIYDQCQNRIRKLSENCQSLQGFLMFHSLGGGTGSGYGSLLLERLGNSFEKKSKLNFTIIPSPNISTSPLQPYNGVLSLHEMLQNSDSTIIIDNEACYDIYQKNLDFDRPTYTNINRLIAQMTSSITAPFRFEGDLKMNLSIFQTNLVPYPRIHFMLPSYSPFVSADKAHHPEISVDEMTNRCFQTESMMVKCDPSKGRYMACSMLYRGDIIPKDCVSAISSIRQKKTVQFVDWCPTGFKVGISSQPPLVAGSELGKMKRNCCMISNSTAMEQIISKLNSKFDRLYDKRAFVHWYTQEGMEGSIWREAREDLAALEKDYQQVSMETVGITDSEDEDDEDYS